MRLKNSFLNSADWLRVHLRLRPRCAWVKERLNDYYNWDLPLAELRTIEIHLGACPACEKGWRETERLLSELESTSFAAKQLRGFSSEQFLSDVMARIDQYEAERANDARECRRGAKSPLIAFRLSRATPRLASAALILLSVSALAYVGPQVFQRVLPQRGDAATAPRPCEQVLIAGPEVAASSAGDRRNGSDPHDLMHPGSTVAANLVSADTSPAADFGAELGLMMKDARASMLLPHTEAQWEDWARKEYPHIMWVYDVLTMPEYGIHWDGAPTYIPEWAKKAWPDANTRPTGWRALICYSGEIFKFDYPNSGEAPNVAPTHESMKACAAIAGYELHFARTGNLRLPAMGYADHDQNGESSGIARASLERLRKTPALACRMIPVAVQSPDVSLLPGYVTHVSANRECALNVLSYMATVAQIIPGHPWQRVEDEAMALLSEVEEAHGMACVASIHEAQFRSLLFDHGRLAYLTANQEPADH